jgi:hypothetical protein
LLVANIFIKGKKELGFKSAFENPFPGQFVVKLKVIAN